MKDDYDRYIEHVRRDEQLRGRPSDAENVRYALASGKVFYDLGYWFSSNVGGYVVFPVLSLLGKTIPVWSPFAAWALVTGGALLVLGPMPTWLSVAAALLLAVPAYLFREPVRSGVDKAWKPLRTVIGMVLWLVLTILTAVVIVFLLIRLLHLMFW